MTNDNKYFIPPHSGEEYIKALEELMRDPAIKNHDEYLKRAEELRKEFFHKNKEK